MQPNAIITVLALSLFSSHAAGADLADHLLGVWRLTGVTHRVQQTGELEAAVGRATYRRRHLLFWWLLHMAIRC